MSRRLSLLLALCLLAAAVPASAQSVWLDREHRPSIQTEILFPQFDGGGTEFPTWTWFVAGRFPVAQTSAIVIEAPYTHGDVGEGEFSSDGSIGNPYIGYEYRPHPSGLLLEAGVRVPLMEEELLPFIIGYYTDVDRQDAFVPNQVTTRVGLHYHHAPGADSRISYAVPCVPLAWIKTGDSFLDESEFFLGYGGIVRYEGDDVRVGGGLAGRWNATSNGADFGEASFHQLDLAADFLHGSVRPGLQVKLPLDDSLTSVLDVTRACR
jgi:hypothetical protein